MSAFVGTGTLVRLALRRDRVLIPVWIVVFAGIAAASASSTAALYPTVASRVTAAEAANATPALLALYGRVYDPSGVGGIAMLKMIVLGAVLSAVLMVVVVIRHTRGEEEAGRGELLGAGVLGRLAPLSAVLLLAFGSSLLLGGVSALGLIAVGMPVTGSLALGLCWFSAGTTFGALAALTAQLTESARAARGLALAALGLAFALRAAGDSAAAGHGDWLTWLSPIGWAQQIRPFGGDRWWPALLSGVLVILLVAGAFILVSRRDLGAGLVRPRLGRASAGPALAGPIGLAWRLQRGALVAWTIAFGLLGAAAGSLASGVGNFLDSEASRDLIRRMGGVANLTDAYLATEFGVMAVVASAYGISASLRLHSEEESLRAEPLLAAGVGRVRWAFSHLAIALAGTSLLVVVAGTAAGITYGAPAGDVASGVRRLLGAAVVQLPAAWVLVAIASALFGLVPRYVTAAWVALVVFLLLGEYGPVLRLSRWLIDASPFGHTPRLPGGAFSLTPLLALVGVSVALLAAGLTGFRHRDVG